MATERAEAAGFPALTRAKQRFLERRATVSASRNASSGPAPRQSQDATAAAERQPVKTASLELVLLDFCRDLDDDLRFIAHEVDAIDASVRQTHQRLCVDLDALTTSLFNKEPVLSSNKPSSSHETRIKTPANVGTKTKKVVVIPDRQRRHPHHGRQQSVALLTKPRSRVARLALQAVHAHVIQHHVRHFLYKRLYCGGRQQFVSAMQLSKRTSLGRLWRRWTQLVSQRRRLRRRFVKLASQLSTRLITSDVCALKAAQMLESDGKYAMAKRFDELKALYKTFQAWLSSI